MFYYQRMSAAACNLSPFIGSRTMFSFFFGSEGDKLCMPFLKNAFCVGSTQKVGDKGERL